MYSTLRTVKLLIGPRGVAWLTQAQRHTILSAAMNVQTAVQRFMREAGAHQDGAMIIVSAGLAQIR